MARLIIVLLLSLAAAPAIAQNATQSTPSEMALQVNAIIGAWAQQITFLQKQNADLQRDLAVITKERDELKAKQEPQK